MSKSQSVQDVIDKIARRLDAKQARRPVQLNFLSALDVFISIDPILGALHKQLLDALACSAQVCGQHGADSPMAEVAADVADSAESAFRTRLIEVRQDPKLRREALNVLRRQRTRQQRESRKRDRHFARGETAASAKRKGAESFATAVTLLLMLQHTLQQTQKMLSLASAFEAVSHAPAKVAG